MKTTLLQSCGLCRPLLAIALFLIAVQVATAQKDSIRLQCPLNGASLVQQDTSGYHWDKHDQKIVLASKDTLVTACHDGKVSNIQMNEEGRWEVVFFFKDYYIWYSGLSRVYVKKNQSLKAGQPVGYLFPGHELELMVYKFEMQLDPRKLMECNAK
ncbi:MAG: peptidoglycan DD-metalloendopeptidase family protein [Chitinophagaceae bacterium]|nr:peptidoglycan DD-metalloendopeptidase family protein [Chitinophagaceae bacterium]